MSGKTWILVFMALWMVFMLAGATPAPPAPPAASPTSAREAPPSPPAPPEPPTPPPGPHERFIFISSGGSWLGVSIGDIDAARARELRLKEERGAEIKSVIPGSPADKAGLKEGQVILSYQGTPVQSVSQLTRMVRETPAGRTVPIEIWSGGATRTVKVQVSERDDEEEGGEPGHRIVRRIEIPPINIPQIDIPDIEIPDIAALGAIPGSIRLGASVETLTPQLGDYFGVADGEGVLVRSVSKGGPGEVGGLRAGDVITKVDDETISDVSDLRSALRGKGGQEIRLAVVRDRKSRTLNVTLPKRGGPGDEERGSHNLEESIRREMEAVRSQLETVRRQADQARQAAEVTRRSADAERRRALREKERILREKERYLRETPVPGTGGSI